MKCPVCGNMLNSPTLSIIGQDMCPSCGEIVDITFMKGEDTQDEIDPEDDD